MAYSQQVLDIEQEYVINKNFRREDMKILRKWVETQGKYPEIPDVLLFLFLHSCYYDMEKTKYTIKAYYKQRQEWPEVFKNRNFNVPPLRERMHIATGLVLEGYTSEGYSVFFVKLLDRDTSQFDFEEQIKIVLAIADMYFIREGNVKGLRITFDLGNLTWAHVPKVGFSAIRKLLAYVQDALPARLKGMHFINTNRVLEKILVIVKFCASKELNNILYVHSHLKDLFEFVPKKCLPKDYGGNNGTVQELHEIAIKTLLNNSEFFMMENEENVGQSNTKGNIIKSLFS